MKQILIECKLYLQLYLIEIKQCLVVYERRKQDFNNNSADKPTETYIKVFLSNGKKLEHRLSDQKQLIKDLENIKF